MPRHEGAASESNSNTILPPVGLIDDEVPPPDLVEGRLFDVGNLVRGEKHVPVALFLRHSGLETVPDDGGALVLTTVKPPPTVRLR